MIEIHKETVKGIPLLHIVKSGSRNKTLPFVMFVHGFTSAKEHNLHFAYLLAEKGIRVVLPEASMHGERSDEKNGEELTYQFWDIVMRTIAELEMVKTDFVERGIVDQDRIGLVGTSMGGIVTLGALTQYDWIKAAVSLMGSPNYEQFAEFQITEIRNAGATLPFSDQKLDELFTSLKTFDLSAQPEKLKGRPLLFWHGKKDLVVPFQPTYNFYEKIKKDYEEYPERLMFIADENADHKVSREALLETIDWFDKYI